MAQDRVLVGANILIVEDEPDICDRLLASVIDSGGTVVGPVASIDEALHQIRTKKIDAAVIDLIVRGNYCDNVADELALRRIPFAVTTGIGADASHPALQAAPSITKPFQNEHVVHVLRGLLEQPKPTRRPANRDRCGGYITLFSKHFFWNDRAG